VKDIYFNSDIDFECGDLKLDQTLYNAYQISIFTNLNLWWADRTTGSNLYKIIDNTVINPSIIDEINIIITDSIQWIKTDGLVLDHTINVYQEETSIKILIDVILPDNTKYKIGWEI
jgi:phage gp46-like protein